MVIWNEIDFKDKGIIVEKTPKISKGKKRLEIYEIDGRDGFLCVDKGTYEPFVLSVECHFDADVFNIDDIKKFLDGYGTLSFDKEREYTAVIQNQISFEKISKFKKFIIQFLVNPIAKSLEIKKISPQNHSIFTIPNANANMHPKIIIEGVGNVSITINNKTFYLYAMNSANTYILDCENKVVATKTGSDLSSQMKGNFPYLIPGTNTLEYTGNITKIEIEYREAYL